MFLYIFTWSCITPFFFYLARVITVSLDIHFKDVKIVDIKPSVAPRLLYIIVIFYTYKIYMVTRFFPIKKINCLLFMMSKYALGK